MGQHAAAIKDLKAMEYKNELCLVTAGFDCELCLWGLQNGQVVKMKSVNLSFPIHYMACEFPLLVTAHAENLLFLFNLENVFLT